MASNPTTPSLQYSWRFLSSHVRLAIPEQTIDGIRSDLIYVPKKVGNDTIMAYFCLNQSEYAYVVKTWTEGLLGLFITLGLPDTQVLRSGPADSKYPLTESRLLLAFPNQQDVMVVEPEVGKGVEVVPGGPAWRTEPIPRETMKTDILHLNLKRVLGRAFFAQIAIPRLFQLLAPMLGMPQDPVAPAVWKKLMDMPPQSSRNFLAENHHKFMVYQLAKVALGRARGRIQFNKKIMRPQREMSEHTQLDGVVELGHDPDSMQKLRDKKQIAADQQRSITPSSVVQNPSQKSPDEERRPHYYQHRVATTPNYLSPPYRWPEPPHHDTFGSGRGSVGLVLDGEPAPRVICYDDGTPEGSAAFLNSLPGL